MYFYTYFLSYPLLVVTEKSFKSTMKTVSPGERFQCSLGVDPSITIEYKPAHIFSGQVESFLMTFKEYL